MIVLLILFVVYVVSVIVTLAYYTDIVKTSMGTKTMGATEYMSGAAFVALIPVLNTIVALSVMYQQYFVPKKHKILLLHELEDFERLNEKKLMQLQKEAESRMFEMDPELWCMANNVTHYESQTFDEYWKELNHLS